MLKLSNCLGKGCNTIHRGVERTSNSGVRFASLRLGLDLDAYWLNLVLNWVDGKWTAGWALHFLERMPFFCLHLVLALFLCLVSGRKK